MQLGIRLHDVKKAPIEERVAIAREQGFACAHVALSKLISEYATDDGALTPGFACHLKRVFQKNDMDMAVLGCYLNLANPNQEALRRAQNRYYAHLRFASLCGAGVVGTETGAVNEAYKYEEANHSEEALDVFLRNLEPVVKRAEQLGVILAIEPVFKHIVWNPARARRVLDSLSSSNLQIIFDPVNLLDMSNYEAREDIFAEAMEVLGPDIAMIHLKDFVIKDGKMESVAAGTGMMNYERILKFIKERKPYVHVTLENTVPDNAVQARKYIQDLWERA
ncbi:MAG: sugar phosphate isomerase/epimerase [Lachnospiraceae bacterium]|nr:sugar phosphate isomerase/epimerase [Lachnospiraceae bacterium]